MKRDTARSIVFALLLSSCGQPPQNDVSQRPGADASRTQSREGQARTSDDALKACASGDAPCTPEQYDRLCAQGENWACDWKEEDRQQLADDSPMDAGETPDDALQRLSQTYIAYDSSCQEGDKEACSMKAEIKRDIERVCSMGAECKETR